MSQTVAAMSLRPGDVAHITSHRCHGQAVNCGDHHISITSIHTEYDVIVIDYAPPVHLGRVHLPLRDRRLRADIPDRPALARRDRRSRMTARKANGQFTRPPGIADWPRFPHQQADQLIHAAREASHAYESSFGAYCTVVDVAYAPPPVVLVSSKPLADVSGPLLAIEAPDHDLDARVDALMRLMDGDPLEEDDPARNVHLLPAPTDVPGPVKGDTPQTPSTEDPPTGATGPGTPHDDPALD